MGYNEKELLSKIELEKQESILPPKKETIGDILKKKREESAKSVEYISEYLKIKPQYLHALESDNFNKLPGQAYVIGFIKSYASFLELDVNKVIAQYKKENNEFEPNVLSQGSDENTLIENPIINANHIIVIFSLVIIALIGAYFFNSKNQNITSENIDSSQSQSLITAQNDNIEIILEKPLTQNTVKNENVPSAQLPTLNLEPQVDENKITFITMTDDDATQQPLQTVISNDIAPEKEYFSSTENFEDQTSTISPSVPSHIPTEYGKENKYDAAIVLRAKDRVWIKLKKDGFYKYDEQLGDVGTGTSVFETILEAGDTYYIPNADDQYLTIGNATAVDFEVNGTKIKPISTHKISRHNIEMDAEKLKLGTAYMKNRIIE